MATTQMRFTGKTGSSVCEICHRPLSDPESVRRGIGPVCAGRIARQAETDMMFDLAEKDWDNDSEDGLLLIPLEKGIFVQRADGRVVTNVQHIVKHHSPTGFEFGYAGSGPADLALNILEHVLLRQGYQGPRTKCFDGECFSLAYSLHQDFKWQFIAGLDRQEGGKIEYQTIVNWIEARSTQVGELWADAV